MRACVRAGTRVRAHACVCARACVCLRACLCVRVRVRAIVRAIVRVRAYSVRASVRARMGACAFVCFRAMCCIVRCVRARARTCAVMCICVLHARELRRAMICFNRSASYSVPSFSIVGARARVCACACVRVPASRVGSWAARYSTDRWSISTAFICGYCARGAQSALPGVPWRACTAKLHIYRSHGRV